MKTTREKESAQLELHGSSCFSPPVVRFQNHISSSRHDSVSEVDNDATLEESGVPLALAIYAEWMTGKCTPNDLQFRP